MDMNVVFGIIGMVVSLVGIVINIIPPRGWMTAAWAGASFLWALAYTIAVAL